MARITRYDPSHLMPLGSRFDEDLGFMWPMARLHQQMNRLFSDAFRGLEEGGEENRQGWTFNPVVDVDQQDQQYEISVELPGVIADDVNVECADDLLVISGSKERKQTRGEGENRQSERIYGSFRRAFRLPDDALREKIEAHFSDGVLTVLVPRDQGRRQESTRRIEVQRGAPQVERQQAAGEAQPQQDRSSATH
ncbi:MAG TPA: Hsp20/alpha crystallin family protein [Woeseiaceae bacterium]|nr:Hsp20/alpha crystallin family protein [Woeseiaceae bacterium]